MSEAIRDRIKKLLNMTVEKGCTDSEPRQRSPKYGSGTKAGREAGERVQLRKEIE